MRLGRVVLSYVCPCLRLSVPRVQTPLDFKTCFFRYKSLVNTDATTRQIPSGNIHILSQGCRRGLQNAVSIQTSSLAVCQHGLQYNNIDTSYHTHPITALGIDAINLEETMEHLDRVHADKKRLLKILKASGSRICEGLGKPLAFIVDSVQRTRENFRLCFRYDHLPKHE